MKANSMRNRLPSPANRKLLLLKLTVSIVFILVSGCSTPSERLSRAVHRGDMTTAAKIFQKGYRPEDAGPQLVAAGSLGNVAMIKLLLDAGVDVNGGSRTALMAATQNGHLEAVQLLVDKGADVNKQQSATVLRDIQYVSDNGKDFVTMREQQLKGAGHNALSLAISTKRRQIVRYLLDHGADTAKTVIYENAKTGAMLGSWNGGIHERILLEGGVESYFIREANGQITTNRQFETEKTASMKELAEASGDRDIIDLLSKPANLTTKP